MNNVGVPFTRFRPLSEAEGGHGVILLDAPLRGSVGLDRIARISTRSGGTGYRGGSPHAEILSALSSGWQF